MDVQYLRSISDLEYALIYVDSSERDRSIHPTPGQYAISFDTPFNNVVCMSVMDASVPSSMFIVDTHNDLLVMWIRVSGLATAKHNVRAYMEALPQGIGFRRVTRDTKRGITHLKFIAYEAIATASLAGMVATAVLDNAAYDHVVVARATAGAVFSKATVDAGTPPAVGALFAYDPNTDSFTWTLSEKGSPVAGTTRPLTVERLIDAGPRYARVGFGGATWLARADALASSPSWCPGVECSISAGNMEYVWSASVTEDAYAALLYHEHEIHVHNLRIDIGDHDVDSLLEALRFSVPKVTENDVVTDAVSFVSASKVNPTSFRRNRRMRMQSRFPYWIDIGRSTLAVVLGFGNVDQAGAVVQTTTDAWVWAARANAASSLYQIDAPGLMNLFGERFIKLRCPEIESHLNSGLGHGNNSAGIGVFKLYDATIAHLRFDFTNLKNQEFHPIGKLSKLSFRFERMNGDIYDFKGIDHHMFVAIHFLKPRSVSEIRNPLNPDYEPDILRYIADRRQEVDQSDTESDEELLDDRSHMMRYMASRAL